MPLTKKQFFDKRLVSLQNERSEFFDYWGQLSDYHLAHRGRFLTKGNTAKRKIKRNTKQYNNTSRLAVRTASSGLMAGMTSPARPWFKIRISDPELNESGAVKDWLFEVQSLLYRVFAASNTYNSLHSLYAELVTFGTGSMGVFENFEDVIRCKTYSVGSYMLGLGADDKVDTQYREYSQSVGQLVKQYGIDNVSLTTKNIWTRGDIETHVPIVHAVEPNDDRDGASPLAKDKLFRSVYYEQGSTRGDSFLLESGFDEFPFMTPRWDIAGEETYSEDCPGMIAIGDTKGLQLGERRFYQALDKVGNPPLQGDSEMKSQLRGGVPGPGDMIYRSANGKGVESIYGNYRPDINSIRSAQEITEDRINRAFFVDLFLMLASSDRRQITAREVAEKHEEKLLMLGPVLERLHTELLDPLINRTFNILQRNGVLPPPPQELVNTEVSVDYVSILAQAQRMVGLGATERTVGFAAEMATIWPEARHKINSQQVIDQYAADAGVDPRIIRSDEEAEMLTAAENQQNAQDAQMERTGVAIQNAKALSEVDQESTAELVQNAGGI